MSTWIPFEDTNFWHTIHFGFSIRMFILMSHSRLKIYHTKKRHIHTLCKQEEVKRLINYLSHYVSRFFWVCVCVCDARVHHEKRQKHYFEDNPLALQTCLLYHMFIYLSDSNISMQQNIMDGMKMEATTIASADRERERENFFWCQNQFCEIFIKIYFIYYFCVLDRLSTALYVRVCAFYLVARLLFPLDHNHLIWYVDRYRDHSQPP